MNNNKNISSMYIRTITESPYSIGTYFNPLLLLIR